ncbi:leucine-rich repeat and calponin homology domain-containing protein 2 isoform X3 [Takifugu rubripes]|uniref:Leucine rich repeats and calponin homology domain containing 2 n=1 Tax=Takifugu rubripes TaxID=31033 RepID=A0A674N3Z5_TAKRU|nr:leucine-rich repeat and calponin homology domain-containing protein 2 isoform X3 [Takifugu rubripes]XP_056909680.1 leucine-rich repeat and calponin homology domain-containing protein 2 isoform X2 [Takifugu flavidus]|eukprot:XP_003971305.2 PREDICTED: leucine-rich repeat and calponin homology domain-containing protein 2 isoform X2 [Takifugu rubripes]
MASSQGGVGAVTALQSHHYSSGPHWSPGVSQYQHQPHTARSLDRVLEDAVSSGILNLSGRKLREYPGLSYDLTDTTQADLSKNRFTEIPPEVCLFAPLESLNLYHNCIKCIPEAIINLQMLTYLDISRNLLSVLPKYLFNLPLKVLLVSNNKLLSIPEEIGKAKDLMELDVSCNEIQALPAQVGRLQALRELNIRRNCLHMLPEELADLPLIRLDFSCNKITEIPAAYRKLRQLQHIILDNNPMQSPPAQICLKGKVHIFKFLNIQACRLDKKPDTLDLPSLGKRCLPQPLTDSMEDFYPSKNHGPDSGIGSDSGDKRLSTTEPSDDDTVSLHSQVSETARADALSLLSKMDSCKDQDLYDFIEPNPDEDPALSECDGQQSNHVSCIKELEKALSLSQQNKDKDWKEESSSDKEQLVEEEDDELKEVLDLRKIAVQLLQQEQQNRFLSHSGSSGSKPRPPPQPRSASLDEGSSGASMHSGQPSSSCSFDGSLKLDQSDSESKWPEIPPVLNQNEDRKKNKYLRKDYLKYKCQSARKGSNGNDENEEALHCGDFSTLTVFGLKPRSAFSRGSRQEYNSTEPSFTMRRKMEHLREELEQIGLLRQNIESRLKVLLPDDVGAALMDGVVLCHLANNISPRSVASIHVPSPAVPKLSMAKCRRNVENFLDACKKIGVPQDKLCLPHHILEERGLVKVGVTVQALLDLPPSRLMQLSAI